MTRDYSYEELELVAGYRRILWSLAAAVLAVGFASLLIAAVDRAIE